MSSDTIQELEKKLAAIEKSEKESKNHVDALINLGYAYSQRDPNKSEEFGRKARAIAESIGYEIGICRSYNVTGLVLKLRGKYSDSFKWFKLLLDLSRIIGFKVGESSALVNLGSIHSDLGSFDAALGMYSEAIVLDEELGNNDGLVPNYINIGEVYTRLKNYDKALYNYKKALSCIDENSASLFLATYKISALIRIASTSLSQDITTGLLETVTESIDIAEKINDPVAMASSFQILGEYFTKLSQYENAIKSYKKTLELYESLGHLKGVAETLLNLGKINLLSEKFDNSQDCLDRGVEIAKAIGSKSTEADGYELLSELYENRGDYQKSLNYNKLYRELHDETLGKDLADNIARIELLNDIRENEKESEIIRLKNVELENEIEERKRVEIALIESEERYRKLSIEDPLTGIFNRRYLFEMGGSIVNRSVHSNSEFCLGMLDLDYFKGVNDKFGHQAGDQVLKDFAQLVRQCIRPNDFFARYGGEEFVVILVDCKLTKAIEIMDRINKRVKNSSFTYNNSEITLTVSGGVSNSREVSSTDTLLELIKLADSRMYIAKELGRNLVVYDDIQIT